MSLTLSPELIMFLINGAIKLPHLYQEIRDLTKQADVTDAQWDQFKRTIEKNPEDYFKRDASTTPPAPPVIPPGEPPIEVPPVVPPVEVPPPPPPVDVPPPPVGKGEYEKELTSQPDPAAYQHGDHVYISADGTKFKVYEAKYGIFGVSGWTYSYDINKV